MIPILKKVKNKVAKKIDYTLDEFGFDNGFDDLDFDFDIKPVKDDRNPVTKVATGFAKGVKDGIASESFITGSIKSLLPRGYGTAVDAITDSRDSIRDLYNSSAEEIRPVINDLQRLTKKAIPTASRYMPGALSRHLEKWADKLDTSTSGDHSYQTRDELDISRNISEIFKLQADEQDKKDEGQEHKDQLKESLSYTKHKESLGQLNQMRLSLSQLTSYQEKITANYQRKSLELQYRQFFVARDSFIEQKRGNAELKAYLESINKNTALPDYVKLKQSERVGEAMRNRFINEGMEGLFGPRTDFIRNIGGRVRESTLQSLKDTTSGLRAGITGAEQILEQSQMAQEMGMGGVDPHSLAGEFAGQMSTGFLTGSRYGNRLREHLSKNETLSKRGNQLQYHLQNIPQYANEFARSSFGSFGLGSFLVNPVKDAILSGRPSRHVDMDTIKNLQEPGIFTRQTNKSINEVIPGLLSRIHHELQVIRTGDTTLEPVAYDFVRNRFDNDSTAKKNLLTSVINPAQRETVQKSTQELIEQIDPNNTLSEEARKALGSQLLIDNMNDRMASPERLANRSIYRGEAEQYAEQYTELFRNYFADDDNYSKRATFTEKYNDLGRFVGMDRAQIQNIVNAGLAGGLADAGILSLGGPDTRDPSGYIDYEKYFNYYNKDTYSPTKTTLSTDVNPFRNIFQDSIKDPFDTPGSMLPPNIEKTRRLDVIDQSRIIKTIESISPIQLLTLTNTTLGSIDARLAGGLPTYSVGSITPEQLMGVLNSEDRGSKGKESDISVVGRVGRKLLTSVIKTPLKATKLVNNVLSGATRNLRAVASGVSGVAGATFDKVIGRGKELTDVFVGTDPKPRLEAWKLKAGLYKDEVTNKVITNFKDIKGNVVDDEGKLVLDAEDIRRAYTTTRSGVKSLYSQGVDKGGNLLGEIVRRFKAMDLTNTGIFTRAKDISLNKATSVYDIYVSDKLEPLLQDWKLKAGHYTDSVTGEIIKSFKDIKNPIMENGKIVANIEQLQKAYTKTMSGIKPFKVVSEIGGQLTRGLSKLTTDAGKALTGITRQAHKGTKWLFNKPEDVSTDAEKGQETSESKSPFEKGLSGAFGLGQLGMRGLGKLGGFLGSGVSEGINNAMGLFTKALSPIFRGRSIEKKLTDIYNLLDERMPGRKIRKGSYEDQMNQKKEDEGKETLLERAGNNVSDSWGSSIYGMGAGALGKLFNRDKKTKEDDESGLAESAAGAAAGAAGGTLLGKLGRGLKTAGKWAVKSPLKMAGIGAAGTAGYNMLTDGFSWGDTALAAGGLAATNIGRTVLMGAGRGALMAGGALLSAVATPVVLGAAAATGAGYLGYKYFTRKKPETLSAIRYAQYGFLPGDDSRFRLILSFEDLLSKLVVIQGDKVRLDINKFKQNTSEIAKLFGIDLRNEGEGSRWSYWFVNRFRPIYLTHMGTLNRIAPKVNLADVDDKLTNEQKLEYINSISSAGDLYSVMTSPFPSEEKLQADSSHVEELIKSAKNKISNAEVKESTGSSILSVAGASIMKYSGLDTLKDIFTGKRNVTEVVKTRFNEVASDTSNLALGSGALGSIKVIGESLLSVINPKIGELTKLRMVQYGLNPHDTELVKKIMGLDKLASKYVTNLDSVPKLEIIDKKAISEVYKTFGIVVDDLEAVARFNHWLRMRYARVLISNIRAFKAINKSVDFINIDSNLSKNEKLEFIKVAAPDWMEYPSTVSPLPGGNEVSSDRHDIDELVQEITKSLESAGAVNSSESKKEGGLFSRTVDKAKGFLNSIKGKLFGNKGDNSTPASNNASNLSSFRTNSLNPNAAMNTGDIASRSSLLGSLESPGFGGETVARTRPLKGDGAANRKLMVSTAQAMGITDPKELAMLLAQLDHESMGFTALEENLNYRTDNLLKVFSKYFKTREQAEKASSQGPQAIASIVYGNRMGNNGTGEGWTYRGRGFIQLTGKDNYHRAGQALGIDLINNPDLASNPEIASKIAVWFWQDRRGLAQAGKSGDVRTATKLINGGFNGLADRERLFKQYTVMDMTSLAPETANVSTEGTSSGVMNGSTSITGPSIDNTAVAQKVNPLLGGDHSVTDNPVKTTTGGYGSSVSAATTPTQQEPSVPTTTEQKQNTFNGFNPNTAVQTRDIALQQKQSAMDNTAIFTPINDSMKESLIIGREHLSVSKESLTMLTQIAQLLGSRDAKVAQAKENPTTIKSDTFTGNLSNVSKGPVSLAKKYAS